MNLIRLFAVSFLFCLSAMGLIGWLAGESLFESLPRFLSLMGMALLGALAVSLVESFMRSVRRAKQQPRLSRL